MSINIKHSTSAISAVTEEAMGLLSRPGRHFLGVCGLGGCGKTSTVQQVANSFPDQIKILQTDWYCAYSSAFRRATVLEALEKADSSTLAFWSDPTNWYDWERLAADIALLRDGKSISMTDGWNQTTGERDLSVEVRFPSEQSVILLDGIYLLHPSIRPSIERVILLRIDPVLAHERMSQRDSHRVDERYLEFKRSIVYNFELPYFEKYSGTAERIIELKDEG